MKRMEFLPRKTLFSFILYAFLLSCSKPQSSTPPVQPPPTSSFQINRQTVDSKVFNSTKKLYGISVSPKIQISFSDKIDRSTVAGAISFTNKTNNHSTVPYSVTYLNNDSIMVISPSANINYLNEFTFSVSTALKSSSGKLLVNRADLDFVSQIDTTAKFARVSDSALLDMVQKQTFKYFWDFGHPVSGLARERSNGDNETVTTGGSGFGIMAMIVGVNRGFITRSEAVARLNTITNFLLTRCQRWHGAFSHWVNGSTGATVPFGKNNGADIVETSFLMQGLLTARQYFDNTADANETTLRNNINILWNSVEWNWFTQNGNASSLYWQYNPNYTSMNDIWSIPVTGWNEALITYVLAASSANYSIGKNIYDNGWAKNGAMKNGNAWYGITLPLGPNLGGPLFFSHYSFLGLNPNGLKDSYADYMQQNTAHSKINNSFCAYNPNDFYGYSDTCWGLTASDDNNKGYDAHSPANDDGVISPTASVSSLPYTPEESMNAIRYFYYTLGDKIWGNYGFMDAFNLGQIWFSNSYLAIDQGPQIVMIENYRSGLLWNLFMSCPEVKTGLKKLGFESPFL